MDKIVGFNFFLTNSDIPCRICNTNTRLAQSYHTNIFSKTRVTEIGIIYLRYDWPYIISSHWTPTGNPAKCGVDKIWDNAYSDPTLFNDLTMCVFATNYCSRMNTWVDEIVFQQKRLANGFFLHICGKLPTEQNHI